VVDTASAKFSVQPVICEGSAATFKDLSVAPAGISLTNTVWDFGDNSPLENHAPGSTFTHTFPAATNYVVKVYAITSDGCRSTLATRIVSVSPQPVPSFLLDKASYCLPAAEVGFTSNSTIADGSESAFTYLWNFGDVSSGPLNTSTARAPVHIYRTAGPFTVNLRVTSGVGCIHDTNIVVNTIHLQPRAAFDMSKPAVCIGESVVFTDQSNPQDGTTVSWQWNFDDNLSSPQQVQQAPLYTFGSTGTYNVSLYTVNSFGCNSDTISHPFTVYPFPVVDAGPDRFVLEGGSVTLQPIVTGTDLTYLWSPALYLNNSQVSTPLSTPVEDIRYTLTVTSRGGCSASDQVFLKVLHGPVIPNTFSPNNDRINDFWEIRYLDTYPNNKVQVFTRTGHLVFESRGYKTPWNGTMGGKPLPVDTYYYIIEPANGRKPITGYVTILK
jgi:gliding motility-associated-like protein